MEIQYFSQINREDIGRPRGKFPSAGPSWKKPSTISKLGNPPRASLITIHRRMEGNKEREGGRKGTGEGKKRFFSSSTLALPALSPSILASIAPSPLGRECGWMNSIVIESHPHFTNGKASLPPAKSLDWTCIFPFDTPQRSPDFIKNPRNLVPSLPSSATPRVEIFPPDAFIARPPPSASSPSDISKIRAGFQISLFSKVWHVLWGRGIFSTGVGQFCKSRGIVNYGNDWTVVLY